MDDLSRDRSLVQVLERAALLAIKGGWEKWLIVVDEAWKTAAVWRAGSGWQVYSRLPQPFVNSQWPLLLRLLVVRENFESEEPSELIEMGRAVETAEGKQTPWLAEIEDASGLESPASSSFQALFIMFSCIFIHSRPDLRDPRP